MDFFWTPVYVRRRVGVWFRFVRLARKGRDKSGTVEERLWPPGQPWMVGVTGSLTRFVANSQGILRCIAIRQKPGLQFDHRIQSREPSRAFQNFACTYKTRRLF